MIEFFSSSTERMKTGLSVAKSSKNFWLVSTNFKQGFKGPLMVGLLKWRHGLGSPQPIFMTALHWRDRPIPRLAISIRALPVGRHFPSAPVIISTLAAPKPVCSRRQRFPRSEILATLRSRNRSHGMRDVTFPSPISTLLGSEFPIEIFGRTNHGPAGPTWH